MSGTQSDFCPYQWPVEPGEDPCSCSSGTQLDPRGWKLSSKLLSDLLYNLIVSFGDPVKVLGPPPVWKLYAGSPTSQPVEEIELNNRLELACYFSHLDWKFFQQFVNILEGFILHYLSNNNHYSFLNISHLHYYSNCWYLQRKCIRE